MSETMLLRDEEPCKEHRYCLSHRTHPCEGCGRIAGRYPLTLSQARDVALKSMLGEIKAITDCIADMKEESEKVLIPELAGDLVQLKLAIFVLGTAIPAEDPIPAKILGLDRLG